jgi:hypothetical protein
MATVSTAAVVLALAQGLGQVGSKLLEKGVLEPALEPAVGHLKSWLGRPIVSKQEDKALQSAKEAYRDTTGDTDLQANALLSSLNILTADEKVALRAEVARTLWLMDGPDPSQSPEALPAALGLPSQMRGPLAAFLWHLKRQLATRPPFQALFVFDRDTAVR